MLFILRVYYYVPGFWDCLDAFRKTVKGLFLSVLLHARCYQSCQMTKENNNISGDYQADEALLDSDERFRIISELTSSFAYAGRVEPDGSVAPVWVSDAVIQLTGYRVDEIQSAGLQSIILPDDRPLVREYMSRIISGQSGVSENRIVARGGEVRWLRFYTRPVWDEAEGRVVRIYGAAQDITEQKLMGEELRRKEQDFTDFVENAAMKQAERARALLASIVESSDDAILSKDLDGIILSWNKGAERLYGYSAEEVKGRPVSVIMPPDKADDFPGIMERLRRGEKVDHYETERMRKDGQRLTVSLTVSPILDSSGKVIGASAIARDITERKLAEEALREQREIVETINRIGVLLSAELDQEKLVQAVTDAAIELTGAQFGSFFYNVVNEQGEAYMLHTLSGVPREAFSHFPMPRATDLFGPTFRGEGTVLVADVKQDPRYGKNSPYYGMPADHLPVTSYLAVPVSSRLGEVLGGLFFGHPEPGIFTDRDARIVEGLAAQTAIAMDNARLYQRAQQAVAEREELLNREQAAREEAETASRAKDEFLGMLSHELRTPLNALMGWTRMLQTGKLDEEMMARAIEAINRNVQLQARLIEDMLDVSRIISGKLRLDAQPTDPTIVVNAALDILRPAAEAKNIRLQVVMDFGAGLVLGDPARLQQVIWNLLSNAIKFTPKDGRVQVQLERVNSHIEITVSDTGPGIDEAFLPHVFERFRQADSTSTRVHGGLGLGLAIVRHLVELHGGTVEAGNRIDRRGAVFIVRLPLMIVRKQASSLGIDAERLHPSASGNLPFDSPPTLDGLRVLAVDDEADGRQLLAAVLEKCGAEVKSCASTGEALEALERYKPDILVSDIGMPGEDGYVLIEKVRASEGERGDRVPAVALTAYARVEDRLRALSSGYDMHVPKPVEAAELAMVIASLSRRAKK